MADWVGAAGALLGGYMAGQGGGQGSIDYAQSPQQRSVYEQILPLLKQTMQAGMEGTSPYQIPGIEGMMPTEGWYDNISTDVRRGIRQPYEDASRQLTESMGGSAGSAMGGASGMMGAAQSDFWSKAGTQMGQQAWGMMQPAMKAGWTAQLQGNQAPFNMMPGLMGGTYSSPVVQPDNSFNWGNALMGGYVGNQMGQNMGQTWTK